jgi:hypothetical protein
MALAAGEIRVTGHGVTDTDGYQVIKSTGATAGLTDTQLRATPVPVSGPLTDAQLRAAAVPVSETFSYSHIDTATTTTVKSGAGVLHSINVNSKGTVASTITVYDNTAGSGTVIAILDSLTLSGTFVFDVSFATGLTLVTTGTVAPDITVSYR